MLSNEKFRNGKNVHIYDARSYTAALGNRVGKNKGYEDCEEYSNASIFFLNIGNI